MSIHTSCRCPWSDSWSEHRALQVFAAERLSGITQLLRLGRAIMRSMKTATLLLFLASCVALVLFAPTVSLCQSPPASAAKPDSVEQTVSRFLVAFANRDVPAFSEFFAEDATMFFPPSATGAPSLRVQGKTEITRAFAELYARLGLTKTSGRQIQPQDLLVQQDDSFAVVTFHLGSDATRGRRSFVFRRTGSQWKIVHLHASDFPTGAVSPGR